MSYPSKAPGKTGELLVTNLLAKKKLQILRQNLQTEYGRIDFLAKDGHGLVVVEIKTSGQGSAMEMITPTKQAKLVLLAHKLRAEYQATNVRVDVVAIDSSGAEPKLRHHKGVIEFNG